MAAHESAQLTNVFPTSVVLPQMTHVASLPPGTAILYPDCPPPDYPRVPVTFLARMRFFLLFRFRGEIFPISISGEGAFSWVPFRARGAATETTMAMDALRWKALLPFEKGAGGDEAGFLRWLGKRDGRESVQAAPGGAQAQQQQEEGEERRKATSWIGARCTDEG